MVVNRMKKPAAQAGMSRNRPRRGAEGLALIEAALIFLLLVIIVMGAIEYGWLFGCLHVVQNAAQIGAREAVLPDSTTSTLHDAVDAVMAGSGLGASGYTTTVSPGNIAEIPVGGLITVTVTVPYSNIELLGLSIFPTPATLRGSVTMTKEGP